MLKAHTKQTKQTVTSNSKSQDLTAPRDHGLILETGSSLLPAQLCATLEVHLQEWYFIP